MAERLGRDLAVRGLVVVSGLARGIDGGALSAVAGATVAILGCGIDLVYPKENKKIYEEIRERGALVSEFPMGTFPAPQNFPIRNRIIAGMALGVVVVEGAQYSGSLITARLAMEFAAKSMEFRGMRKSTDQSRPVDELVETSGLTSSEVLATLFDLEMKGMVRQLPGKQFLKVLL